MNEQNQTPNEEPKESRPTDAVGDELVDELTKLGNRFVEVARVAWASDERKRIETELKTGLNKVAAGLEEGFRKVGESEQTKDVLDKAEDVAENVGDKVRESKVANDLATGLLQGLRALGEQLEKWAEQMEEKEGTARSSTTPPGEESQDIPIDRES